MKLFPRAIFLLFFSFAASYISAQQVVISPDDEYGYDPLLFNGRYYTFLPPFNTGGTQYFSDNLFETGSVSIRGVNYTNLSLNYDIFNQQLILQYKNKLGAENRIIISDAWLEGFSMKGINFEVMVAQDTLKKIFQVLGAGPDHVFYHWRKDLILDSFHGAKNHIFTKPAKEMYLFTGGSILRYWNNKNFYSLFPPDKKNEVKDYLRKNNVKVKRATDKTITDLMYYCNSLYKK
jgi:hypothetical protein